MKGVIIDVIDNEIDVIDIYINIIIDMHINCVYSVYRVIGRRKKMNPYYVDSIRDGKSIYYLIRCREDMSIVPGVTKYLMHKIRANKSPNTVKRIAFSLSYYLTYLEETGMVLSDVFELKYDKQHLHFTDFLQWIKKGRHNRHEKKKTPSNNTCNTYLQDVFGWYQFLELQEAQLGDLKVLSSDVVSFTSTVGVRFSLARKTFNGYLKGEENIGRTIEEDHILVLLDNCTNVRDQLLILLLAETGFRIGEMLGIRYTTDIDYKDRTLRVQFRDDNDNKARAKYAEYRRAKISKETFEILMYYLSEYRQLLKKSDYLFVTITGEGAGKPLDISAVYAMLGRLEKKTGIAATPHMLRHYFANERRNNGWDIALISKALGHKHISTTEKYLNIGADELIEATDEYYKQNKSLFGIEQLV